MTPDASATDASSSAPPLRRRLLLFALFGMSSGALSGAVVSLPAGGGILLALYAPGLIFGVAFGLLLTHYGCLPRTRVAPWIFAATISNAAAVQCGLTVWPFFWLLPTNELALGLAGLCAGAAGGGLLASITAIFVGAARARHCLLLAAAGAVLGSLVVLFDKGLGVYAFYVIWQGGYAAALAIALPTPTTGGEIAT